MNLKNQIESHIRVIENFPEDGISFKDFSQVFQNPNLSKTIIKNLADQARGKVDVVCGIESRGFILGFPLALELGVPFVMIRKKGKLPPPVISASYKLEYGEATLEIVENQIAKNARVLIHDDVLATGGTAAACNKLVEAVGAKTVQYSFLIELGFLNGRENLGTESEIYSIINYKS